MSTLPPLGKNSAHAPARYSTIVYLYTLLVAVPTTTGVARGGNGHQFHKVPPILSILQKDRTTVE